jgi:hypothetical protein
MRGRRHKLQVSTFPFLAVLLCAMGSLILVLLVMDRKAHKAAQARARHEAAQLAEESARNESARRVEREKLQQQARKEWEQKRDALHEKLTREQIEMQLQMRKVREELQGIAARLHYEQDTSTQLRRKAQDEQSRLQAEEQLLRTLRSTVKQSENQSKESSQALRRMTLDLLQMEQVLKDLKASKQREQKTFSVVPYHGRRGENRRPLYVECTAGGVIFHPERKAMPITAFLLHSGDSSNDVRAEVERRIAQQRQKLAGLPTNVDKTPYLLLLLRPSGVTTYHLFQRALRGLSLDFGYEFIDEDWVLDFPADDVLPSTQPWMIATKTPSRPAPPSSVAVSPPSSISPHPMGGPPLNTAAGTVRSGIRGFRAGEASGGGSGVKGDVNQFGSSASGTGGGGGGSASGTGGGIGGTGPGLSSGGGIASSQSPFGNPGTAHGGSPFGSPGGGGVTTADSTGSLGTGQVRGGMASAFGRGNGHGHPSAMPPSFPSDESGGGYSGGGGTSGSGFRGMGALFPIRGPNAGSGSGYGYPGDGPPGATGATDPGLGPPQVLTFGPGQNYPGGGTGSGGIGGIGGTGSIGSGVGGNGIPGSGVPGNGWAGGGIGGSGVPGNGIPGNGWGGGGTAGSGTPGSATGMGASAGGRTVIARGNNFGDAPNSAYNGGGSGGGAGGPGLPGAIGSGGPSSGTSIAGGPSFGVQGSGGVSSGTQNGGSPGGQAGVGTPMPNPPASGGAPSGATVNNALNSGAQGPGSYGPGAGQALNGGGEGIAGIGGTAMTGAPGSGSSYPTAQINNGANTGLQGSGSPSPGGGGPSSGGATVIGGSPNGQAAGGPMPANGGRSSDVVIFVDPVTGQPTNAPRPTPSPDDASAESPPPEESEGKPGTRRIRVIPATSAASGGGAASGDAQAEAMNRFAPTPSYAPPPRRLTASRPVWIHGGRDWTIYVECRAGAVVLYPSQQTFTVAQASSDAPNNPLIKAIQQMIDRRQSSRRPGEPPYHCQVCWLVRPEHVITYLKAYPVLEALPVPKMRRNLDADDDVIGIVTGAVP